MHNSQEHLSALFLRDISSASFLLFFFSFPTKVAGLKGLAVHSHAVSQ